MSLFFIFYFLFITTLDNCFITLFCKLIVPLALSLSIISSSCAIILNNDNILFYCIIFPHMSLFSNNLTHLSCQHNKKDITRLLPMYHDNVLIAFDFPPRNPTEYLPPLLEHFLSTESRYFDLYAHSETNAVPTYL